MKIAIDYDGTFTADPTLWAWFITKAKERGHDVAIVTMRYPSEPIPDMPMHVVYTSRKAKRAFYPADIWIDDNPHWVNQDAA